MTSPPAPEPAASTCQSSSSVQPPPLPPRALQSSTGGMAHSSLLTMASKDPRSSSQQSLTPDPEWEISGKRRLLLVFIHGFMGDETSFRNFPAHVHNLVSITLADTYAVHTKIYPRYKSREALEVARDDFSKWLTPHETPLTDVVLLGHSMGGLVAAEISLLFRHNIIGVINFDVPFLGMHPGIVKAGLKSIFKPWPTPEERSAQGKPPSRMDTLFNPKPNDPNYNPSFHNDINLPVRKGWENALHFVNKHSNGLIKASKGLVKSYGEFGGAMADYRELKDRYARVRALEEDDEKTRQSADPGVRSPPRIRFVNYYTTSPGRPKTPKSPKSPSPSVPASASLEHVESGTPGLTSSSQLALASDLKLAQSKTPSPRISVDEHRDDKVVHVDLEEPLSATSPTKGGTSANSADPPELPEIPPIPQEPPFVDLAQYPDKAERRAAEKEHTRTLKEYQQAVKARNRVIKERSKIEERWEKQRRKTASSAEHEKPTDGDQKIGQLEEDVGVSQLGVEPSTNLANENSPYGSYDFSKSTIMAQPPPDDRVSITDSTVSSRYSEPISRSTTLDTNATNAEQVENPEKKPKKLREFCMLPPKDGSGNKDPTWIRVYMDGVDAVTAHTTLFFMSEAYEKLVGDVGQRIEEWVREAETMRLVRDMEGL
ncbi:hypothetical protein EJ04DRAFT_76801 [Polyplosphaeria fusca]|uniref:AB hydrolase-1 domain-containing protein n=1 Tax=Polyplosphaeria fusca TaxID=682080 RepID=A0A9P4QME6_9PLEO|nr:hypothetical protein EJ04DRAFT_76801 [Polyplosphaeria fusca]